jgi:ankyrin repeat protein
VAATLIDAGAGPSASVAGSWHSETPLHWAASKEQLTDAFWQACHGGQRRMAEHVLHLGADLNGTPSCGGGTPLDAADSLDTGRQALVEWLQSQGAEKSVKPAS